MKRILAIAALATLAWTSAQAGDISGAGATFPYPIYSKWADAYKQKTGVGLNYQSIGSGGGIKQIKAKTVTFGASDMPLKPDDLDKSGLVQFPMIMGGVVPVVNLKGIKPGELTLDGATLASIFLGEVTKWDDPKIKALNANVTLPSTAIAVVHRSDGSGTSFLFTDFLSKTNPEWKDKVGANSSVEWPVGLGAKGNEGVAGQTTQTDGAIGYVEYAYAKQNKMTYTKMVNADGKVVEPKIAAFQAAAAGVDWSKMPGYYVILTNQAGADSWPITGASFIIVYKQPDDPDAVKTALKFFEWAYSDGDKMAEELDYVPIPDSVVSLVKATWKNDIKDSSGKAIY
ncbi:MAG TPA: phosphate ABC transporter substrate-binding protein PstS [Methylomirabilota bacterium]|nr:phosphate ABC transporter substrate-binding protein PstS [Methylomirabilota bacterium]